MKYVVFEEGREGLDTIGTFNTLEQAKDFRVEVADARSAGMGKQEFIRHYEMLFIARQPESLEETAEISLEDF